MELHRVCIQAGYLLGTTELADGHIVLAETEHFAVVFEVAAFDHPVLFARQPVFLLVAVVDSEAAGIVFVAVGGGVGDGVGFEQSPHQIVDDGT